MTAEERNDSHGPIVPGARPPTDASSLVVAPTRAPCAPSALDWARWTLRADACLSIRGGLASTRSPLPPQAAERSRVVDLKRVHGPGQVSYGPQGIERQLHRDRHSMSTRSAIGGFMRAVLHSSWGD